jgi:cadmium resistance protein CadD (predicted permease)
MAAVFLGMAVLVLLAATAWKYSTIRPTLHRYDRMGAAVFFLVVGLPFFVAALALIAQPLVA